MSMILNWPHCVCMGIFGRFRVHCRNLFLYFSVHSFIHSLGYFYSASSSPLLLRGAPDTARILCLSFTPKHHRQSSASEGLAQGPYLVTRAGFKPTTLWTKGDESTNEPPCPTCGGLRDCAV